MGLRSSMRTPATVAIFCPHSTKAIRRLLTGWSLVGSGPGSQQNQGLLRGRFGPLIVPRYPIGTQQASLAPAT